MGGFDVIFSSGRDRLKLNQRAAGLLYVHIIGRYGRSESAI
jgi:hypothetical protein